MGARAENRSQGVDACESLRSSTLSTPAWELCCFPAARWPKAPGVETMEEAALAAKHLMSDWLGGQRPVASARGEVEIGGQEYVLIRKDAISELSELLGVGGAKVVLYDLGKRMGESEAKTVLAHPAVPAQAAVQLLLRPFFYMARGLGTVDILDLRYDPNDLESFMVLYEDHRPVFPFLVCGFSAGWKEQVLGVPLVARPIPSPQGDSLRVVVAHQSRIMDAIEDEDLRRATSDFNAVEIRLPGL